MIRTMNTLQFIEDPLHRGKTSPLPYPDEGELFSSDTLFPPYSLQNPSLPQHAPQLCYDKTILSQPQYPRQRRYTPKQSESRQPTKSFNGQVPLRTFEVQFANWTSTHIQVAEVGMEDSTIYTADLNIQKPHLIFNDASTEDTIATANFCCFAPEIETCVNGQDSTLHVGSGSEMETTYESRASKNMRLFWKNRSTPSAFDLECLDENSEPLARLSADFSWDKTRAGQLEIFGARATGGAALDEVVATGIALAHYALTQVDTADTSI